MNSFERSLRYSLVGLLLAASINLSPSNLSSFNLLQAANATDSTIQKSAADDKGTRALGEVQTKRGNGDETHQIAGDGTPTLTTQQGMQISDDQNSLKAGARGPALLEDFVMREKIFHFDHERIPERVVHARGFGAHGYFELTDSLKDLSMADIFQRPGEKTPVFVRFSTVAGNKGSADLARDVRGFAVKFYTKKGNWDLVGNNIPVFFIQDGMKFPDLIHAAKDEPDSGTPQAATAHDNFWDFISLSPESTHMVMWAMSDRAIPRSFRFMEGFGVHTFKLVNADGKGTFVKFLWKPNQGLQSVTWNEAVRINGADPDYHRHDLWDAIKAGNYPEWDLCVQTFDEDFAKKFDFDVLDATKDIPEELIKPRKIGHMVLNRTVDNFFAETEQVAFCTSNVVPGIDFSDDPLLQIRNFSYLDTQLSRLGSPNFAQLPINAPKCPVFNFQQDGHMAMTNVKGKTNYEPNSYTGPRENPSTGFVSHQELVNGAKTRMKSASFADHYSQARQFYISQTPVEQKHMSDALVFELSKVNKEEIRVRMVANLENVDKELAERVAKGLGIKNMPAPSAAAKPTKDLPPSPELSIVKNGPNSFKGRKLAILVSDGADAKVVNSLKAAAAKEGSDVAIVAPTIGGVDLNDGTHLKADFRLNAGPSALFDAVAIVTSEDGATSLAGDANARGFVADAYSAQKFIAFNQGASGLLKQSGVAPNADEGTMAIKDSNDAGEFISACRKLRLWSREEKAMKLSSL